MSLYRVEVTSAAARDLRRVRNRADQAKLVTAIDLLARDPRPPNARRLVGRPGWRVRVGDYRIIYAVEDDVMRVVVVALGHRREIYR